MLNRDAMEATGQSRLVVDLSGLAVDELESRPGAGRLWACGPAGGFVLEVEPFSSVALLIADVPGVAGTAGPFLVAFFAVALESEFHAVDEGWQGVAVPLLERVAGQGFAGSSALVGQDGDLVDKVGVEGPAQRDHGSDVPGVLVVEPGHERLQPGPQFSPLAGFLDAGGVPGSGQGFERAEDCLLLCGPVLGQVELSVCVLDALAWVGEVQDELGGRRGLAAGVGHG